MGQGQTTQSEGEESSGFAINRDYLSTPSESRSIIPNNKKQNDYGSYTPPNNESPIYQSSYGSSSSLQRTNSLNSPSSSTSSSIAWRKTPLCKVCEQVSSSSLNFFVEHWVNPDSDSLTGLCIRYNIDDKSELGSLNNLPDAESLFHMHTLFIPIYESNIETIQIMSKNVLSPTPLSRKNYDSKAEKRKRNQHEVTPEIGDSLDLSSLVFHDDICGVSVSSTHLYLHNFFFVSPLPKNKQATKPSSPSQSSSLLSESTINYKVIDFKQVALVTQINTVKALASVASGGNICISRDVFDLVCNRNESQFSNMFMIQFKDPNKINEEMPAQTERIGIMKNTKLENNLLKHALARQIPVLFLVDEDLKSDFISAVQDNDVEVVLKE